MKTELFSLANANDVYRAEAMVRTIRYDSGAAAGGVEARIRMRSMLGGAYDVEMIPGRLIKLPEVTRGIVVTNLAAGGAAINGKITFGAGDVNDNSLVGSIDLTAATIASLIGGKYNVRPEPATGGYAKITALAANTADLVIDPTLNVNGAIVHYASIGNREVNVNNMAFLIKSSAPATVVDGVPLLFATPQPNDSGANNFAGMLPQPVFVPAGQGVYFIGTLAISASGFHHRACRFTLL